MSIVRKCLILPGYRAFWPDPKPYTPHVDKIVDIVDKYMGAGWSCNTPESENEVLEFVRTEGIYIENVYTSKLMYGYKDMVKNGMVDGDSAVIHTGGFGSLFSQY